MLHSCNRALIRRNGERLWEWMMDKNGRAVRHNLHLFLSCSTFNNCPILVHELVVRDKPFRESRSGIRKEKESSTIARMPTFVCTLTHRIKAYVWGCHGFFFLTGSIIHTVKPGQGFNPMNDWDWDNIIHSLSCEHTFEREGTDGCHSLSFPFPSFVNSRMDGEWWMRITHLTSLSCSFSRSLDQSHEWEWESDREWGWCSIRAPVQQLHSCNNHPLGRNDAWV